MSQLEVYFSNHERAFKFPWSIYHKPLLRSLLKQIITLQKGEHVLVIGPGAFEEIRYLKQRGVRISILDIDPRVLELHKKINHDVVENFYLVGQDFTGYPDEDSFDLVYAKEVIEHLPDYLNFLSHVKRCLRPAGRLWLSTPNYGFFLLPLLEKTFLELVAKVSGFSRKDIHPSKFTNQKLFEALKVSGLNEILIETMPFKLSLVAIGQK